MYLTGREIKDLAEYVGFTVEVEDEDYLEQEFSIEDCPVDGVLDDDGKAQHYSYVVRCDGCEGNECSPLGMSEGDCNSGHHPFDDID